VRPRLAALKDGFTQLDQQLAVAQKAPIRMAEDDWRTQTQSILQDLLAASGAIRTVNPGVGTRSGLLPEVLKLADDVDFVANEFRMALDYDPDATHLIRAGRAEQTTIAELNSILSELR
jgi:hypothetical protein